MALTKIDDRGLTTPIDLLDNEKIRFGTGNDLEIHHNGTDTYISHTGSGVFRIEGNGSNGIVLRPKTGENSLTLKPDGAVELYYNNSKKFETKSYGANMPDDSQLYFGSDDDMVIKHDGSNGFITNGTGYLHIKNTNSYSYFDTNSIYVRSADGSEDLAKFLHNGACELYYDNVKRLETYNSSGVTGIKVYDNVVLPDDGRIRLGNATYGDLQIYHTGTSSQINDTTSELYVQSDLIHYRDWANGHHYCKMIRDGAVELYYDNSKKFETYASGTTTTGHSVIHGNISMADDYIVKLGSNDDLKLYHNQTDSIIKNDTGVLRILADSFQVDNNANSEVLINAVANGQVELYHDGNQRLKTTTTGIYVNAAIAIGAEAANNTLNVSGSSGSGQTTLYYGFGTVDLTSASDERVKDNVVPTAKGLDEILKLPIVDFTYSPEYSDDSTTVRTGGIAQEWQKIDPNLVNDEDKDLLFINYKETIPLLIKAVQELSAEVETLKSR